VIDQGAGFTGTHWIIFVLFAAGRGIRACLSFVVNFCSR